MKIQQIKTSDLMPYFNNPRKNDDAVIKVAESIKAFGFQNPIIADKDLTIIAGHTRWKAALKLDLETVPVIVSDMPEEKARAYRIADNRLGEFAEWDWEKLNLELDDLDDELKAMLDFEIPDYQGDDNIVLEDKINKDLKNIRILNLYAGIGGNRKLWGDLDITSVEYNPQIAEVYKDYFPNDKLIIGDAHEYLEKHFQEFDFIWSSPPCPTHSRMRKQLVGGKNPIYPDMKLWQEILFLQGYFEGKFIVENVKSWYDPLVTPQERGRHYYWANFDVPLEGFPELIEIGAIDEFDGPKHEKNYGYDLSKYKFTSDYPKDKILRNMVHPNIGKFILENAYHGTEAGQTKNGN